MREGWCHGLVVERNTHCLCIVAVHLLLLLPLQWWRVVVCLIVWGLLLLLLLSTAHYMCRMNMRCMYSSVHHHSTKLNTIKNSGSFFLSSF